MYPCHKNKVSDFTKQNKETEMMNNPLGKDFDSLKETMDKANDLLSMKKSVNEKKCSICWARDSLCKNDLDIGNGDFKISEMDFDTKDEIRSFFELPIEFKDCIFYVCKKCKTYMEDQQSITVEEIATVRVRASGK